MARAGKSIRSVTLLAALVAAGGCGGASPQSGVAAMMRVQNAQYVAGALDRTPAAEAPLVQSVVTANNRLYRGQQGKAVTGSAGPGSYAVLVGLEGDVGHWVVPVSDADQNSPGDFTFGMRVGFSPQLAPGPLNLILRAVARDGTVGPPQVQALTLAAEADPRPLVVTLSWDSEADLDLRVTAPASNGGAPVEIGAGINKGSNLNPPKPGDPAPTQAELDAAGRLDFDSNAQCVIDGGRVETVAFAQAPPAGRYVVKVDTFSLCGEVAARWRLTVSLGGQVIDEKTGQSSDVDTRFSHGAGAGLAVSYFDVSR
jgi:hypothetical protein